jgi:hypothetical protein
MKSLGGNGEPVTQGVVTVEEALRYAMSLPVATTVSGIDSLAVLRQNLAIARGFRPMAAAEMEALRRRCAGRRRRPPGTEHVHDGVRWRLGPRPTRPALAPGATAVGPSTVARRKCLAMTAHAVLGRMRGLVASFQGHYMLTSIHSARPSSRGRLGKRV